MIRKLLEDPVPRQNFSNNVHVPYTAQEKTRAFYKSCVHEGEEKDKDNLRDLLNLVNNVGGSSLEEIRYTSENTILSFNERVQHLHNKLGLNVFFTWGAIDFDGQNRLAIIAGGFNPDSMDNKQCCYGLFRVQNLVEGFAAVLKKRHHHKRSFIILLIAFNLNHNRL